MAQKKVTKKIAKKSGISVGKVVAIGAGVAALGAGAYYFLGSNGKKNQKKAAVWMSSMKKEISQKMTTIKNATEPIYHKAVDAITVSYGKQYKEHAPEIKAFAKQLKSEWKGAQKQVKKAVKKIAKK